MDAYWVAIYEDGSVLPQFDGNKENLFKDINLDKLVEFQLVCGNRLVLSFFPKDAVFGINGFLYMTDLSYRRETLKYKLIYYKRVYNNIGEGVGSSEVYNVGFETNINGKNHKRIVSVKDYFINFRESD